MALALLEERDSIFDAVIRSAREYGRSPRKIWTSLLQQEGYRLWLLRQDSSILQSADRWSDRVAEIILSSSSDEEIDERIFALGSSPGDSTA